MANRVVNRLQEDEESYPIAGSIWTHKNDHGDDKILYMLIQGGDKNLFSMVSLGKGLQEHNAYQSASDATRYFNLLARAVTLEVKNKDGK